MDAERRIALALPLVALAALACEREQRRFRLPPASSVVVTTPRQTDQQAGSSGPADPQAAPQRALPTAIRADENAYALSQGVTLYRTFNCVGCHANGGGGIGPALIDGRWLYGHELDDVTTSIVAGRPNGMPSFGGRISHDQATQLAAYVRSLAGLVRLDAAPGRRDGLDVAPPPNTKDREPPRTEGSR